MNCEDVQAGEILERYIAGQLDEAQQQALEEHFFTCEPCFDDLQLLQSIQTELKRAPKGPQLRRPQPIRQYWWVAAAAALVLVAGGLWWQFRSSPAPSVVAQRTITQPAAKADPDWDLLARIDPPHYVQPVLRSGSLGAFRGAMQQYSGGDYKGAIPGLAATAKQDPGNTAAQFYLGVCYLMDGQADAGIERLKRTIALGDSPQLETAHWFLAQALTGQKRLEEAAVEAQRTIALDGNRKAEAQKLLDVIQSIHKIQ